jgi:hypothetical protein
MAKIIEMTPRVKSTLVSENEFSKVFKVDDVDLYVTQAFDEESNTYFLICSIPVIPVLNVEHIKFPIAFQTKEEMGQGFTQLTPDWASKFISDAIEYIKENRRKVEEETLQSRLNQLIDLGCIESNVTDIIFYKESSICTISELKQLSPEDWEKKLEFIKIKIENIRSLLR